MYNNTKHYIANTWKMLENQLIILKIIKGNNQL